MARWKNIMKCYPFTEDRLLSWKPPFICQPKYDGVRCRAVPLDNGEFILLSSEENVIYSVPHINDALKDLPAVEYDGELYTHGLSFEQIISITSRTVNLHSDYTSMEFHIFDIVDDKPQAMRLINLSALSVNIPLARAPIWLCNNLSDVMKVFDKLINLGYEGIIVRDFSAPYLRRRSTKIMKFKPKKEDEYGIIGVQEEISINNIAKGTLGSLTLLSGDGNVFSVGTGFDADQRRELWKIKEDLIGKIAKVKYQHLTTGKKVPRFPVFVEIVDKQDK